MTLSLSPQFAALSTATAKEWSRDKVGLFFSFLFPLVFLLVFGLLYHDQHYQGQSYINYIGPGVLCWAVGSGGVFGVAYSIMSWRESDLLRLIRMTPTTVPTVLGSRLLVAVLGGAAQTVFFLAIAALPFLGLHVALQAIVIVAPMLTGIAAFFALGLLVGTYSSSPEAVAAVGNIIMLPMAFLSGTFYPVSAMPAWLRDLTQILPLRHMIDGVSGVVSGTKPISDAVIQSVVLLGFAGIFAIFAGKLFRWSNDT